MGNHRSTQKAITSASPIHRRYVMPEGNRSSRDRVKASLANKYVSPLKVAQSDTMKRIRSASGLKDKR